MTRYLKIILVAFLTLSAAPAFSDTASAVSSVTEKLADQGYRVSRISTTFFGRVKIVSRKDDMERETVLNPYTGEILRDLVRRHRPDRGSGGSGSGGPSATSGGGDASGDGDSDSDDGGDGNDSDDSDEADGSDESDSPDSSGGSDDRDDD